MTHPGLPGNGDVSDLHLFLMDPNQSLCGRIEILHLLVLQAPLDYQAHESDPDFPTQHFDRYLQSILAIPVCLHHFHVDRILIPPVSLVDLRVWSFLKSLDLEVDFHSLELLGCLTIREQSAAHFLAQMNDFY